MKYGEGDNHFIAGCHDGADGQEQTDGAAVDGLDLGARIIIKVLHASRVIRRGLAERGNAVDIAVLGLAIARGLHGGFHDIRRCGVAWFADAERDHVVGSECAVEHVTDAGAGYGFDSAGNRH